MANQRAFKNKRVSEEGREERCNGVPPSLAGHFALRFSLCSSSHCCWMSAGVLGFGNMHCGGGEGPNTYVMMGESKNINAKGKEDVVRVRVNGMSMCTINGQLGLQLTHARQKHSESNH
jgi:hypothetical protein